MERRKILLTGASGTIGRILYMHLGPWHEVYTPTSKELDLTNRLSVVDYSQKHQYFDVIIHCAIRGANDVRTTDVSVLQDNLKMYFNLADYDNFYGKFINIASGCEFGYDVPLDIKSNILVEELITGAMPELPYGMSKNIIARDILNRSKGYNLRLWGIIAQTRLFQKLWDAVAKGDAEFVIDADRFMDYISEEDMAKIVRHYVDVSYVTEKDINMVYPTKYKVSEVLQRYIEDNGLEIKVRVTGEADSNYYGSGTRLQRLGIL